MSENIIDHVIFMVSDPETWVQRLASIGINAIIREEGEGSDKHRLAVFDGYSYLEIIRAPAHAEEAHLVWEAALHDAGEGFGGFSISVQELGPVLARLYHDQPTEVKEFGATLLSGEKWQLRYGAPEQHENITQPFLLQSLAGRPVRAPAALSMPHDSGISLLNGITLSVKNLDSFSNFYRRMFPVEEACPVEWSQGPGRVVRLGKQWIAAYLAKSDHEIAHITRQRGEGPVEISLGDKFFEPWQGQVLDYLQPLRIRTDNQRLKIA